MVGEDLVFLCSRWQFTGFGGWELGAGVGKKLEIYCGGDSDAVMKR